MSKAAGYLSTLMTRRTQTLSPRFVAAAVTGRQPLRPPVAFKPADSPAPRNPIDSVAPQPRVVERVVAQRIVGPPARITAETRLAEDRTVTAEPPHKKADISIERRVMTVPVPAEPVVHHTESVYEVEVVRESPPQQITQAPERPVAPVARERPIETKIDWPAQLTAPQRSAVRIAVERQARDRMAANPRAIASAPDKVEVRVDQVNVRFDAPAAPRPATPQTSNESRFGGFFLTRSLR